MTANTIEIHGIEGTKATFNQNEREGVNVGSLSTTGDAPSLDIVLTQNKVYVIHHRTRDIMCMTDIDYNFDDDGKPTEPKDNAVNDAIDLGQSVAHAFMQGWEQRHEHGVQYPDMTSYAEDAAVLDCVQDTFHILDTDRRMRVKVTLDEHFEYALTDEWHVWIENHDDLYQRRLCETNKDDGYAVVELEATTP